MYFIVLFDHATMRCSELYVSLALIYLGFSVANGGDEGIILTHSLSDSGNNWVGQTFWIKCVAGSAAPDQNVSIRLTWKYKKAEVVESKAIGCLRTSGVIKEIKGVEKDVKWFSQSLCKEVDDGKLMFKIAGTITPDIGSVVSNFECKADYYNYTLPASDEKRRVTIKSDDVLESPTIWELPSNYKLNVTSTVGGRPNVLAEGDLITITCTSKGGSPESYLFRYDIYRGDVKVRSSTEGFSASYRLKDADRVGVNVLCTDANHFDYPDQTKITRNFSFVPHHFALVQRRNDTTYHRSLTVVGLHLDCGEGVALYPPEHFKVIWKRNGVDIDMEEPEDEDDLVNQYVLRVTYNEKEDNTEITCTIKYLGDVDAIIQREGLEFHWRIAWVFPLAAVGLAEQFNLANYEIYTVVGIACLLGFVLLLCVLLTRRRRRRQPQDPVVMKKAKLVSGADRAENAETVDGSGTRKAATRKIASEDQDESSEDETSETSETSESSEEPASRQAPSRPKVQKSKGPKAKGKQIPVIISTMDEIDNNSLHSLPMVNTLKAPVPPDDAGSQATIVPVPAPPAPPPRPQPAVPTVTTISAPKVPTIATISAPLIAAGSARHLTPSKVTVLTAVDESCSHSAMALPVVPTASAISTKSLIPLHQFKKSSTAFKQKAAAIKLGLKLSPRDHK